MSQDRDTETVNGLKSEIKALQESCVNACHIIENAPPEFPSGEIINEDVVNDKINLYVKGLQAAVHNSNSHITTDSNLLTAEFLGNMKQKIVQVDELTAYTAGCIRDVDTEISRLKNLISVAEEAQSKPRISKNEVLPEHLTKAKDRFRIMKNEVQGLIQSLLPHDSENVKDVLGDLMSAKLTNTSDEYIPIDPKNFDVIQILKDMNIVTVNPYNQFEVKFNYSL